MAIIIDAFLGQTDQFMLPLKKYHMQEFVRIWSIFDPKATGYLLVTDLDPFVLKLAKSSDSADLVVLNKKVGSDDRFRRRFIALLNIPTFD